MIWNYSEKLKNTNSTLWRNIRDYVCFICDKIPNKQASHGPRTARQLTVQLIVPNRPAFAQLVFVEMLGFWQSKCFQYLLSLCVTLTSSRRNPLVCCPPLFFLAGTSSCGLSSCWILISVTCPSSVTDWNKLDTVSSQLTYQPVHSSTSRLQLYWLCWSTPNLWINSLNCPVSLSLP